jgi:hypothetical protein
MPPDSKEGRPQSIRKDFVNQSECAVPEGAHTVVSTRREARCAPTAKSSLTKAARQELQIWGDFMKRNNLSLLVSAALVLSAFSAGTHAANVSQPGAPAAGKLTMFLADPDLGVVGSYTLGADTLYFEARNGQSKDGGDALSVRLLDASGRTIALSGHSMDARWLGSEHFDADAAAASQLLASPLAAQLDAVLADPVFAGERAALSRLASDTARADLSLEVVRLESTKSAAGLPSAAVLDDYYRKSFNEIALGRDKAGALDGNFRSTRLQSLQLDFPTEMNEEGSGIRIETYARLANRDGTTLSAEFGGDFMPAGWSQPASAAAPEEINAHLQKLGEAVTAAHLVSRMAPKSVGLVPDAAIESFDRLATSLRDNLLPRTDESRAAIARDAADDKAGGTWSPTNNKSSNSNIWRKGLVNSRLAEHSANYTSHYVWTSRTSYYLHHDHRFCNHGGCPYASGMSQKCQFSGNFHSGYAEAPQQNTTPGSSGDHSWHTCNTHYDVLSGLGSLPIVKYHNCHDDTWTQLHYVNLQRVSITSGRCGNQAFYAHAPACTDSGAPR